MSKKGYITICKSKYVQSVKNGAEFISVSFSGHNEGSGRPCDTVKEAKECVERLRKENTQECYKIKIFDETGIIIAKQTRLEL